MRGLENQSVTIIKICDGISEIPSIGPFLLEIYRAFAKGSLSHFATLLTTMNFCEGVFDPQYYFHTLKYRIQSFPPFIGLQLHMMNNILFLSSSKRILREVYVVILQIDLHDTATYSTYGDRAELRLVTAMARRTRYHIIGPSLNFCFHTVCLVTICVSQSHS